MLSFALPIDNLCSEHSNAISYTGNIHSRPCPQFHHNQPFLLWVPKWRSLRIWWSIVFLHPSLFWIKKTLFNHIHTLFHSNLILSFIFLIKMINFWWKNNTIFLAKNRHLFWNGAIWPHGTGKKRAGHNVSTEYIVTYKNVHPWYNVMESGTEAGMGVLTLN